MNREGQLILPRALLKRLLGLEPSSIVAFLTVLEMARYNPEPVHHCGQWIIVGYGQVLKSKTEVSAAAKLSRNTLDRALKELDSAGLLSTRSAVAHATSKTMFTIQEPERWIHPGKEQRKVTDLDVQKLNNGGPPVAQVGVQKLNNGGPPVAQVGVQKLNNGILAHERPDAHAASASASASASDPRARSGLEPQELHEAALMVAEMWAALTGLPLNSEPLPDGMSPDVEAAAEQIAPMVDFGTPPDIVPAKPRTMEQLAGTVAEWWQALLIRISHIPWLTGNAKRNGRNGHAEPWRCSLDWLAQGEGGDPGARVRLVAAGKYDPKSWRYAKGQPISARREQAVSQQQAQEA